MCSNFGGFDLCAFLPFATSSFPSCLLSNVVAYLIQQSNHRREEQPKAEVPLSLLYWGGSRIPSRAAKAHAAPRATVEQERWQVSCQPRVCELPRCSHQQEMAKSTKPLQRWTFCCFSSGELLFKFSGDAIKLSVGQVVRISAVKARGAIGQVLLHDIQCNAELSGSFVKRVAPLYCLRY